MRLSISIIFIVLVTAPLLTPSPTLTPILSPTPVSGEFGKTILVTNTADSGSGTLRRALLDAQSGDTITFDPVVFPPEAPVTIHLTSGLPPLTQGNLMIDGSNAGVVLDGTNAQGEWVVGLPIHSDGNTIQGLQIVNFSGAGIQLCGQFNTIGGDRSEGSGPTGQGILLSGNADGIGIEGRDANRNKIAGNLIGTDITGKKSWGNRNPGIYIQDGANSNVIGPDNIIAYNEFGIDIRDPNSFSNTITRNSIHDNRVAGIWMQEGANSGIAVPVIFDFDLAAGTLTGAAAPNSIVEIFSDSKNQGEIYEGQTKADDTGAFTFNKGSSFTGPNLTATVTDSGGNTSMFSVPTSGTGVSLVLQEGNNLPKARLYSKQSRDLADNRIGSLWDSFWVYDMDDIVDNEILPIGLKRVKLAIDGISFDLVNWYKPEFVIDPSHDDVITRIAENGITITYILTFWDKATWPGGEGANRPRFKTEEEIQRYLDYVRFIVRHFKDRVQYFEIWNEPDMGWDEENIEPGVQAIEVDDYINLVKRAVPVIRQEYPDAKIVVGSTMTQAEPGSREYLLRILSSDIMPLVDVVAWHPGGPSPEYEYWRENYYNYPSLVQEIKDLAWANGFRGEYSADEMVWWTEEDFPPWEPWTYSDRKAAKYYARFIIIYLGMDVTVQPGGISKRRSVSFHTIQNLCTIMAGNKPTSLPLEIESRATNIKSYSFSLPNGDKLLALWTHGVAVDDDPGVKADIKVSGFTDWNVMGIDTLRSFQQPMLSSSENGDMVIQNLIVRDYPLILRLTPAPEPTSISISLLATTINRGESVTVSGSISPAISGAMLHLTYRKAGEAEVERTVTTAPDGSFSDTYTPDAAGSWSVEASWEGDVKYAEATSQTLEFTVVELPPTGSLKIIVQDENENSLSGVTVSSTSQPKDQLALIGSSGTDGSVTFADVKIGAYTIQTSRTGYETDSKSVTVIEGETTTLMIQLKEQVGTIKIFMKDKNGDPVGGAAVTSTNQPSGQSSLSGTTGSDGSITFNDVKIGSYTFQATKSGYLTKSGSLSVKAGETVELEIALEKEKPKGGIPGFPYESIILGLVLGALMLWRLQRRQ